MNKSYEELYRTCRFISAAIGFDITAAYEAADSDKCYFEQDEIIVEKIKKAFRKLEKKPYWEGFISKNSVFP